MKRWLPFLLLASCGSDQRMVVMDDVNLRPPSTVELESRLAAYRKGSERWHGDPLQVAHTALNNYIDVPWRGTPFRSDDYEFIKRNSEHPEWGSYVVRGFEERGTGRARRYRVKVCAYEEIWYATQVSHFIDVVLPDDRDGPPNVGK